MRVVVSRVKKASVKVDGKVVGKCDKGLLILVGFTEGLVAKLPLLMCWLSIELPPLVSKDTV